MSLLFDQNISFRVSKRINDFFPGTQHVSDVGLNNASDYKIWEFAKAEGLAIVSFDSDFYDFSIVKGHPPKIVWIRSNIQTSAYIINLLISNKEALVEFLFDSEYAEIACLEID